MGFHEWLDLSLRDLNGLPESDLRPTVEAEREEHPLSDDRPFDFWGDADALGGVAVQTFDDPTGDELPNDFSPRVFDPADEAVIRRGVRTLGVEALACYKSKRFLHDRPFPGTWGIYLLEPGLQYVSTTFHQAHLGSRSESARLAHVVLHRHERFHFHFDMWTLVHEHVLQGRRYDAYRRVLIPRIRRTSPTLEVEETLANHHALASIKNLRLAKRLKAYGVVKLWLAQGPSAYGNIGADTDFLRSELAQQVLRHQAGFHGIPGPLPAPHGEQHIGPSVASGRPMTMPDAKCPNYLVSLPWGRYMSVLRRILPPLAPPSSRELERFVFNYLDGNAERETDHRFVRIDNGELLKLPNNHGSDLAVHEIANLIGKAGMSNREWAKELSRTRRWKKHCPRDGAKPPRPGF